MKIGRPVAVKSIPERKKFGGKARNPIYDDLAERVLALPVNKTIPVECETKNEVDSLIQSMKNRSDQIKASRRGLTVYFRKG